MTASDYVQLKLLVNCQFQLSHWDDYSTEYDNKFQIIPKFAHWLPNKRTYWVLELHVVHNNNYNGKVHIRWLKRYFKFTESTAIYLVITMKHNRWEI